MAKKISTIFCIFILLHSVALACFLVFQQYFQQDEWHGFGIILSYATKYITADKSILGLLLGDRVAARIITFSLFNLFGLNPVPYGTFALILHLANTYLVFILARRLTKQSVIAFLSSLFFLINEVGHEAYSWFGTMSGSATSVLFFLISIILFIRFIDTEKTRFAILSALLLWVSFLFKEVGAFAFIFYPMLFFILSQRKSLRILLKSNLSFIVLGAVMLIFFVKTVLFIPGDRANYVSTEKSLVPSLLIHAIQYPAEGVAQTIIPNLYLFKISDITTRIIMPNLSSDSLDFLIATQNINAEITIIVLLLTTTAAIFWLTKKILKNIMPESIKTMQISIIITLLSFLPYIVINRSFSYLDSRYYYVGSIGISIFLATFLINLLTVKKKIVKIIALLILALYIFVHESTLFFDFKLMADRSRERQIFLKQVEELVPELPKKTVFFITGDSEGYYGLPELKTPFQSGLGQVIMVKYATKKQLNPAFFKEETLTKALDVGFLYDILGQGYRGVNEQGFGYYYNQEEIKKALTKKLFSRETIISLYYEHKNKKLVRLDLKY